MAVLSIAGADAVLSRFPEYVDELIPFAGFPGIPEQPFSAADLPGFYRSMVERGWDLAIQMQGNGLISNSLVALLGASVTAGYYLPGQYRPDHDWFMEYPAHLPEVRRHLALMEFLGFPSQGRAPGVPGDRRGPSRTGGGGCAVRLRAGRECRRRGRVRVHPPGGDGRTAALVAGRLRRRGRHSRRMRDSLVFFTGQGFETGLVGRVRRLMKRDATDLSGRTSLGALAALIEGAALVVCNDTGISHLAAALRVPSVVVFAGTRATGSDPLRWAPLDPDLHVVVSRQNGPTPARPRRHPRGACCLGDACSSPVLPEKVAEAPGVPLSDVLEAVHAQLGRHATVGDGR